MNGRQILVIEDDASIRRGLVDALTFAGYRTVESGRGDEGLELAISAEADLLLLDVVLPGIDGFAILKRLRHLRPQLPVILLTARGEEPDRVKGLAGGADDYVVKPFGVRELLARVEAVLRRAPTRPTPVCRLELPGGFADLAGGEVQFHDGERTALSEKETETLRYLAGNGGRTVSREELLTRVWGLDPQGLSTRTIDMHVARLREKLRDDPTEPKVLMTVRGKGYMFAAGRS